MRLGLISVCGEGTGNSSVMNRYLSDGGMDMKLGLSSYSLYQAIRADRMTMADMLQWAADRGCAHAEIVPLGFEMTEAMADELREKAAACGIELSNYAIGADFLKESEAEYEREIARVMREVDLAARLGVRRMRHDAANSEDRSIVHFNRQLKRLAAACRRIADHAAQYGIVTSVENHGFFIQASERVQALVHAVDRPNFRTTLDVGNFLCVDEDPLSAVKNNLPYASMVHIKDFYYRPAGSELGAGWFRTSNGNWLRGAIAGHGDLKLREIVRAIKASGYDGYISLEFEGMEDCLTGAEIGLENVRRLWEQA